MSRFISILTVILFLPVALVPPGFMPAVLADGNGYLMLCPSKGVGFSPSSHQAVLNHSSINASSGQSTLLTDHHHHHNQPALDHQVDGEYTASVGHDETHQANSEICDYATLSSGQDLIQTVSLESYPRIVVQLKSHHRARLITFSRLKNKQSRAPPLLILSS